MRTTEKRYPLCMSRFLKPILDQNKRYGSELIYSVCISRVNFDFCPMSLVMKFLPNVKYLFYVILIVKSQEIGKDRTRYVKKDYFTITRLILSTRVR